jgi:hypothetical protein
MKLSSFNEVSQLHLISNYKQYIIDLCGGGGLSSQPTTLQSVGLFPSIKEKQLPYLEPSDGYVGKCMFSGYHQNKSVRKYIRCKNNNKLETSLFHKTYREI